MPRKKSVSYTEGSDIDEFENLSVGSREHQDTDEILTDDLLQTSSEDDKKRKKTAKKKKTLVKRKTTTKKETTRKGRAKVTPVKKEPEFWNSKRVEELRENYPDNYWTYHAESGHQMIHTINENHVLESIPCTINDQAPITSMALSQDGTLLATFSNIGAVKIWDVENDFALVRKLRDTEEKNIDEFYCGKFVADSEYMTVGGKLKDRHRWSAEDDDNHILPCPIKIFNVIDSKVVTKLEGHTEEILCIKALEFDGKNYLLSTSQDGSIIKWHMDKDWITFLDSTKMDDNITCMAFTVSFVPNTGNKYFLAATDEHVRLYDFENAQLLQTFSDLYSSYCDCGKFVRWLDESLYFSQYEDNDKERGEYAWFITRGAELCDVSEGVSSKPNTCTLHKLVYPTQDGEQFKFEQVKKYQDEDYHSNSWLVKIASNGRYLLAPTIYGQIFVFNMLSGQVTAILKDHQDMEVRDVIFHPYRPLLFSCGDDGCVKVYTYSENDAGKVDVEQDLDVGMIEIEEQ
ncbi:WD40 repeat-like protein [Rhizopus microsporus var. microsporus]|uniref:WD40 repeat-like protein n=2 Tax=Rhizopus microsporus TaxID=58291 RepID=A0A2G4TAB1_RHIZD|nr:WD40 repeat-like protein [Rhizopus microsporus ATCC 52813]ORE10696.1 WD40 repeat-like protein [Rhizopus microsporus var. microsporus]PHZ17947.1 WD40 repeat-like protein [Rhizopus microsporus ATCC 52813]